VARWLTATTLLSIPVINAPSYTVKWDSIPALSDYRIDPGDSFWDSFPSRPMPKIVQSSVDHIALKKLVLKNKHKLSRHQFRRALKACKDIAEGGDAYQLSCLPPVIARNTSSAYENGRMLTDKIATWIDKGFVAGPFVAPPTCSFRANPLMAISRNNSIRPVINMSAPSDMSFNSNVNLHALEKVYMCTAQMFSYSVLDAGVGAVMSKFDLSDAYKCIPAKLVDLWLQGFKWLNRFFVETRMIFGAVPSVCNFDRLGNTILNLVRVVADIPGRWIHRCLDDIPVVTPAASGLCERFSSTMLKICNIIGIGLAPICPRNEKAFVNQSRGTVLGIIFDTSDLTWTFPEDKLVDLQHRLLTAVKFPTLSLKQVQELVGSVNSFSQMCPIAKCFRQPLTNYLSQFNADRNILIRMPLQVEKDIAVLSRIVQYSGERLPIAARRGDPPLNHLVFTSDAAGAKFSRVGGERICSNLPGDRGVCSIGHNGSTLFYYCRLSWPQYLLDDATDSKGAYYGSKTTTLELVGLLLPYLTIPGSLAGRHVVLEVDNSAIWHGWNSRGVGNDVSASILIRALYLVSYYLGSTIYVKHVPRLSTEFSSMADRMSRVSSTTDRDLAMLKHVQQPVPPEFLMDWLSNPVEDWDFACTIVDHVVNKLSLS